MSTTEPTLKPDLHSGRPDNPLGVEESELADELLINKTESVINPEKTSSDLDCLACVAVYLNFLCLGISTPLLGATLVHMEILLHQSTHTMSFSFTAVAVGCLVGALICSLVYEKTNKELALFVAITVESLMIVSTMFDNNIYTYITSLALWGVAYGFKDAGLQSYSVCVFQHHRLKEPLYQLGHAWWPIGAAICPLLIKPFLVELADHPNTYYNYHPSRTTMTSKNVATLDGRFNNTTFLNALTAVPSMTSPVDMSDVSMARYAYLAIGMCVLIASIPFGLLYSRHRAAAPLVISNNPAVKDNDSTPAHINQCEAATQTTNRKRRLTIALLSLVAAMFYFHLYSENIPSSFYPTFVIKHLRWSVEDSTHLVSVLFGAQVVSRFGSVLLAAVLKPRTMLAINIPLIAISFSLLLFVESNQTLMWISAVLSGLSIAATFPTIILWVSETMVITGPVGSVVVTGKAVSIMTGPILVGYLMDHVDAMCMVYVLVAASFINFCIFIAMLVCTLKLREMVDVYWLRHSHYRSIN